MIMVTQAPAGASCGWRVFPKGGVEWSSVTEMKRTRVIGSCAEAVEAITKAGASKAGAGEGAGAACFTDVPGEVVAGGYLEAYRGAAVGAKVHGIGTCVDSAAILIQGAACACDVRYSATRGGSRVGRFFR